MGAAPVERPVASAAYSFVRFSGGAVAPLRRAQARRATSACTRRSGSARPPCRSAVAILAFGRRYLRDETPRAHAQQAADLVASATST